MTNYWESRFSTEGAMWGFEPAESAFTAIDIFKSNGAKSILIPGMGYGRNAGLFIKEGFEVTGIEISESAIKIAKQNGLDCKMHHGSVTEMPFDTFKYDGVFCYALIHVLNKTERKKFLQKCHNQLNDNGLMIFVVTSKESQVYGRGKLISRDRFRISKGLEVFFYDEESIEKEFSPFGLVSQKVIEEPVKFETGHDPVVLQLIVCKKQPAKNRSTFDQGF